MISDPEPVRADDTLTRERAIFVTRQQGREQCCSQRAAVTHDHLVVGFCTRGVAVIEQQGTWSLAAGDVLLIPAGAPHRHLEARDADLWCLGLCPVCFRAEGGGELLEPLDRVRSGAAAVLTIPEPRRALLSALYAELEREIAGAATGTLTAQKCLVSLILTEVARAFHSAVPSRSRRDAGRLADRPPRRGVTPDADHGLFGSALRVPLSASRFSASTVSSWFIRAPAIVPAAAAVIAVCIIVVRSPAAKIPGTDVC